MSQLGRNPNASQAVAEHRGGAQGGSEPQQEHVWTLIQALMHKSYMRESECQQLVKRIIQPGKDADFGTLYRKLVQQASKNLAFAQLQIKSMRNPMDNTNYVGLVNTHADDASKMASTFSIPQREYFKSVVEAIAVSTTTMGEPGTPHVPQMMLINLDIVPATQQDGTQAAPAKKLSRSEQERTLSDLANAGWLSTVPGKAGFYGLGARTFLELGQFLLSLDLPQDTQDAWREVL